MPGRLNAQLDPQPLLDAVESFHGRFIDLDQGIEVSATEFAAGRRQLAQQLAGDGIGPGDRVVVAIRNGATFPAALWAIVSQGASPLLVHWQTPSAELQRTAAKFGAKFLYRDAPASSNAATASARLHDAQWEQVLLELATTSPDELQMRLEGVPLHPTSGTTGQPKIAVRPATAALAEAAHYIETANLSSDDTIIAAAPMSHAYAFGMCVMVPFLCSASVIAVNRFYPRAIQRAFAEHNATIFPAVPAMLDMMLMESDDMLQAIQPRCVFSAGAPLSQRTAEAFHHRVGIAVRPLYGTTETGGISIATVQQALRMDGSVGLAMNGVETRTAAADDEQDLGDVGRLLIRSESLMAGYLGEDGLDESMVADCWFDTGDLAWMDDFGGIHLKGRQSDMINVNGMKVVPSEVEEVIRQLPEIQDAVVYGGPHPSGSQMVKASLVASGEANAAAIREHCEHNLVFFKRPTEITFLPALPKTPSGKVIRNQLP